MVLSEGFVDAHGLADRAVEIVGQAMVTDLPGTLESGSAITLCGADMSRRAAQLVYDQAGLGPDDLDVIELHDCFSTNELLTYEALGLCGEGEGAKLIDNDETTYGGRWVVNPSGGLISKGHPLGATGLAQCAELTWQLRGSARAAPGRRRPRRAGPQHRSRRRGRRHRPAAGRALIGALNLSMTITWTTRSTAAERGAAVGYRPGRCRDGGHGEGRRARLRFLRTLGARALR